MTKRGELPKENKLKEDNQLVVEVGLTPETKEEDSKKYVAGLRSYHRLQEVVKILLAAPKPWDKSLVVELEARNQEKHEKHLRLLELGRKIDKDENSVLVDIIRQSRTLESYDLPEFSIMVENDVLQTGIDNTPFLFNLEEGEEQETLLPATEALSEDDKKELKGKSLALIAAHYLESVIPPGKFVLIFAILPFAGEQYEALRPDDYYIRYDRAKRVAAQLNGKVFNFIDTGYHNQRAGVMGVMFDNKDFERVVKEVRDNDRFRLGEQFYDKNELEKIENRKKLKESVKKRDKR